MYALFQYIVSNLSSMRDIDMDLVKPGDVCKYHTHDPHS